MKFLLTRKQYGEHFPYAVLITVQWFDGRTTKQTYHRNDNNITEYDFRRWALGEHLLAVIYGDLPPDTPTKLSSTILAIEILETRQ